MADPSQTIDRRGVKELLPGIFGVRSILVWCYLVTHGREVVLVDTGVGPHGGWIKRWFKETGRQPSDLKAILLTHGHIDHMGCAAELQKWSKSPIYLHPADHKICLGKHGGPWPSRALYLAETGSNVLWWTRRLTITDELVDGAVLPYCGGLEVVHLPGHTLGQVGIYSHAYKVLFAADALLCREKNVFFPHRAFNLDDQLARTSILRVAEMDVDWVYPGHHRGLRHNLMDDIRRYAAARRASVENPPLPATS